MHMTDALLSPAVGGTMWLMSAGAIIGCSKKISAGADDRKIPLMGVMGAFIFAAQMINFSIPVTGSSGHLGGGLLLAILLGPYAAFLTIASVLMVQALFFADGGLLALGCNMINLGFFPAFVAYPLVYQKIAGVSPSRRRIAIGAMAAAIIGLQLGSLGVVMETVASDISSLPLLTFAAIMQPVHLAIGIVEGLVTASILSFIHTASPEIIRHTSASRPAAGYPARTVVTGFLMVTLLMAGIFSWFASDRPDGLEWSITRVTGQKELVRPQRSVYGMLASLQERLSFLPDYSFRSAPAEQRPGSPLPQPANLTGHTESGSRYATSVSGIIGGALTLGASLGIGFMLKPRKRIA